ncbi:prepilin peptidase [Ahrensia sp. R2A130]|uniref:A24 family peptidase n=1 Tax=Ahrensia sp. R2A130 TaxID=744979 RepID=UPI0001E0E879|nr:prepilin peptidase [Ahrensia sp. R2A130]EFL89849.1 peptidase A24A prepilin type IV [Ahrensia sp. R2A130]
MPFELTFDHIVAFAVLTVFPLCVIYATFSDLLSMKISNLTCGVLVLGFFILAPLSGMGWQAIAIHSSVAVAALVMGMSFFSMGVMGGGDAKLIAAVSLWLGLGLTLPYILAASLLGAVVTLVIVGLRKAKPRLPQAFRDWRVMAKVLDRKEGIPYGLALGPAALVVFTISPWVTSAARASL